MKNYNVSEITPTNNLRNIMLKKINRNVKTSIYLSD